LGEAAIVPGLDAQSIATLRGLQVHAAGLLIYQSVLADAAGVAFLRLLAALCNPEPDGLNCLQAYGQWFQTLATEHHGWQEHLLTQILKTDNCFTQQVQQIEVVHLPAALIAAVKQDLQSLQVLYHVPPQQVSQWVQVASDLATSPVFWQSETRLADSPLSGCSHWAAAIAPLAAYYRQRGTGIFSSYRALRWQAGQLVGISHPDPVRLDELVGYPTQQQALLKNTEFLLAGYPALNVLLYGSRGSGKSSLIKALLNHYADRPLRLIEVAKADLKDLSQITELLRSRPQKFILFVDDLSFEEDDDAFKALKVLLEGNLTARPPNIVVYATSNRRHLIREFFGDRPRPKAGDELHTWDTMQEKLSFSDRFGLHLTFEPADQPTYLDMVRHLADRAALPLTQDDLEYRALQWATRQNGRSGRTARQFIDFLKADLSITSIER
jgi:hypothetical protein